MNGTIEFTSELGKGSSFFFAVEFQKQVVPTSPISSKDISNLRVLIVDDNPTSRQILDQYTSSWGMRSDLASSGQDALKMLQLAAAHNPYKLVVLDMHMPGIDGITLARSIKRNSLLASTHLIMLTSLGDSFESGEVEQAGIEACVPKPVKGSRLFDSIFEVLSGEAPPTLERRKVLTGSLKLQGDPTGKLVRILLAEDNVINQKVARNRLRGRYCRQRPRGSRCVESALL
jgi:CheY-like chemotaxis protein